MAKTRGAKPPRLGHQPVWLMPLNAKERDHHPHRLRFTTDDYLELVDWAGRAIREGKRGAISRQLPGILQRLNLNPEQYLRHVQGQERGHESVVLGHATMIREVTRLLGRKFLKGLSQSRRLYVEVYG